MDNTSWESIEVSGANIRQFMTGLEKRRATLSEQQWKKFVDKDRSLREWRDYLLNDPYTRRGYEKPRGYSGDAVLMDFAYKHPSITSYIQEANDDGKCVYEYTSNAPQSLSAVSRTKFIGEIIEKKARENKINIASIASGHGREFECLTSEAKSNIETVLAVDSDIASLDCFCSTSLQNINTMPLGRNIFKTRLEQYGNRDLVYSLGLFDYLSNDAAVAVLENMCNCVSDNGTVVIANLHHQAENLGYCEAIMDWWMIPRNEDDLEALASSIEGLNGSWSFKIERIDCFCYLIIEA